MNKITKITKQNIFDCILLERVDWSGHLEEDEFLSRIFDLSLLPSTDARFDSISGDIWQHRVNNPLDWDEYWIFNDRRLNLLNCDDTIFLQFLCEMLHPVVRRDKIEVTKLVEMFNEYLSFDSFELIEITKISGHSVFAGRNKTYINQAINNRKQELRGILNEDYIVKQITLMEISINNAPDVAIGIAKELIESICKTILAEKRILADSSWDLPRLMKETAKELKLTPKDITDEAKASETIRKILGSLSTVVQGIGELRNHYGSGHGKDAKFKGLNARHAKLAVSASSTLAIFLLETHILRAETSK